MESEAGWKECEQTSTSFSSVINSWRAVSSKYIQVFYFVTYTFLKFSQPPTGAVCLILSEILSSWAQWCYGKHPQSLRLQGHPLRCKDNWANFTSVGADGFETEPKKSVGPCLLHHCWSLGCPNCHCQGQGHTGKTSSGVRWQTCRCGVGLSCPLDASVLLPKTTVYRNQVKMLVVLSR